MPYLWGWAQAEIPVLHGSKPLSVQVSKKTIELLLRQYAAFVLPIQQEEAKQAALLRAAVKQQGRVLHLADALIAGTALAKGLPIATLNVKDFEALGMELFNPFSN